MQSVVEVDTAAAVSPLQAASPMKGLAEVPSAATPYTDFAIRIPSGSLDIERFDELRAVLGPAVGELSCSSQKTLGSKYPAELLDVLDTNNFQYVYLNYIGDSETGWKRLEEVLFNKWGPGDWVDRKGRKKWVLYSAAGCSSVKDLLLFYYVVRSSQVTILRKAYTAKRMKDTLFAQLLQKDEHIALLKRRLAVCELKEGEGKKDVVVLHEEVVRLNEVATGSRDVLRKSCRMADQIIEELLHSKGGGMDLDLLQKALLVRQELRLLQASPPPLLSAQTGGGGTRSSIKKTPLQRSRCPKKAK